MAMNEKGLFLVIIVFAVGFGAGSLTRHYLPPADSLSKTDTITVYDTVRYSRFQLEANTCQLDWNKFNDLVPEYVFIEKDSVRDTSMAGIPYVILQRQYQLTEMNGVRIAHSGIGSRIDSVELYMPIRTVTSTVVKKDKKHCLSIGLGMAISSELHLPITLEYGYRIMPRLIFSCELEYDWATRNPAVEIGVVVPFEW